MGREDYIKGATSKIFNNTEKKAVECELNDHILKTQDFIEEIGYEPEDAENKAVEKMGEYEEISEQLGALHNDFYTPTGDIIGFVIWLAALGGLYYVLNKYIFSDIGAVPITLAAICISAAAFFISAGVMLSRNRLPVIIGTLLCGGATSAFIYFCIKNVSTQVYYDWNNLKNLLFINLIPKAVTNGFDTLTAIPLVIFTIFILISIAVALIYYVKYRSNNNSLLDNRIKRFIKKIMFVMTAISVIACILFCYKFFDYRNYIKKDYSNNYQMVLEMCQKCQTIDDVNEFVKSSDYPFVPIKDDSEIKGYTCHFNTADLTVSFNIEENNENKKSTLDRLINIFADTVLKQYKDSYEKQYDYCVNFSVSNLKYYKNGLDSVSLSVLKTSEEELDELYRFETENHTNEEKIAFYKANLPRYFYAEPTNNSAKHNANYSFTYLTGNGEYEYDSEFNTSIYSDKRVNVEEQKKKTIEILNENPDISNKELSKLTGAKLINPAISYDEFLTVYNTLIKSFSGYGFYEEIADYKPTEEEFEQYRNNYSFFEYSDDLLFLVTKMNNSKIVYFSSRTNITFLGIEAIKADPENDEEKYSKIYDGNFRKVHVYPIGYFGKNKCPYLEYENVPYFTKNGTRYTYYVETNDDGSQQYYLVSQKGDKCESNFCFVDKDGYLVLDKEKEIKPNGDDIYYHDKNGNTYTKALETSWDENGNIISFENAKL